MSEHPAALLAALAGLLTGAVVAVLDHALSFIAVVTAVATATVRYFAVLRGAEKSQVERVTAYGFFFGLTLSVCLLALDRILGG